MGRLDYCFQSACQAANSPFISS